MKPMTVRELIDRLSREPGDAPIWVGGNGGGIGPLARVFGTGELHNRVLTILPPPSEFDDEQSVTVELVE